MDQLSKEVLRGMPSLLVAISRLQMPKIFLQSNWLEVKHNPAVTVVDVHYLSRCLQAGRFLGMLPGEEYFPSGGIVLSDTATANSDPTGLAACLEALHLHSRPEAMWQMLLLTTDSAASRSGAHLPPNPQVAGLLQSHAHQLRILPEDRWLKLAQSETSSADPPLLLRVALRESVKEDTAPYRRHIVAMSSNPAVAKSAGAQRLQLKVCRSHEELSKYLTWLKRDGTAGAAVSKAPWPRVAP